MRFQFQGSEFATSTFSDRDRRCVAVSIQSDKVLVTNSNARDGVISFTREEWNAFLLGAKAGEFDLAKE